MAQFAASAARRRSATHEGAGGGEVELALAHVDATDADLTQSITEAERLAQPESFDHLHLLTDGYSKVRHYAPRLLEAFEFGAAPN